ncbi:scm-like with four MBT domains protein 1 [Myzus persicae]|uniref:scm-like with four MBT domains protein 1 n=1 Tax=Myzus persicae TaxID=13164 RepID=UPI000B938088|nr:scm-like with four MBT domains protein 1 [Myzus persicae]
MAIPEDLVDDQSLKIDVNMFDWNKYLAARNAKEVPQDFFHHICKSELNGIEIGSVVEIENEDQSGYWFASVCSTEGISINLRYFGDNNDQHSFSLKVTSPRIHSLNWGSENNKKLIPPYPDRFSLYKPEVVKEKVQDCELVVSSAVLQMGGAPIHNIFKCGMFVEVQDREYPYRVWISKVLRNVGGRLFLQMQGINSPEEKPFWLFYLNERVFPFGWAEQKGLPWRVMNFDASLENSIDSSVLLNVLKPKTPEQHSFKVGEMLEVINPYSMMVFYVATIVKIYDNRYFKVEVDNEIEKDKRICFVATKGNPYLFHAGWASEHKFLLKTPTDWNKPFKFSWSKYLIEKKANFAAVNNLCRKKITNVHRGMKLEAVDPLNTDCIRVATVKGFADHWMLLSFDRTSCCQELLHLRSVYSDEVFPAGWCNKHNYSLSVPKLPYNDSKDFEHCYYSSDIDIDFSQSDQDNLTKYPDYLKGEIFYHFCKREKKSFDDGFEEKEEENNEDEIKSEDSDFDSNDNVPITSEIEIKQDSDDECDDGLILDTKSEPELDEEFHDALYIDEKNNTKTEEVDIKPKEVDIKPEEVEIKPKDDIKPEEDDIKPEEVDFKTEEDDIQLGEVHNKPEKKKSAKVVNPKKNKKVNHIEKTIENVVRNSSNMFSKNKYEIKIYFNKDCYSGGHVVKKKIPQLPDSIGPGPVSSILREAITLFVDLDYFPCSALKKIKKIQNMLFNGPGGVEMWITTSVMKKTRSSSTECLLLPESKKKAKKYCSALCNLSGMCEFFMTTEDTECPHGCNITQDKIPPSKLEINTVPLSKKTKKNKHRIGVGAVRSNNISHDKTTHSKISRVANKLLDRSNKPLVARYKHYMGSIMDLETHVLRLNKCPTELESSIITEIIAKKNRLKIMDKMEVFSNTKSKVETIEEKLFVFKDDWKTSFENYYRQNPRFKKFKIDIGRLEHIKVTSNPKSWSPRDVYKYLSNDLYCRDIGLVLYTEEVDGIAFMMLNEEQLLLRLRCTINLAIRVLCHIAEVKYVCLTEYCKETIEKAEKIGEGVDQFYFNIFSKLFELMLIVCRYPISKHMEFQILQIY